MNRENKKKSYAKGYYKTHPCNNTFAAPEYMPEKQIRMYNLVGKHISRFFMSRIAKNLGCKEKLDARPYEREAGKRK